MAAIVFLMIVGYILLVSMGGLLFTCIEKIPGASRDPKYQSLCKIKWISWLFPLDNRPNGDYNDNVGRQKPLPYHMSRYYDPYNMWNKDEV